jgi:hypothetical protein
MTPDEQKAYALHHIQQAAKEVEFVSLFEMYPEYVGYDNDGDLSDDDAYAVDELIRAAKIEVTFP